MLKTNKFIFLTAALMAAASLNLNAQGLGLGPAIPRSPVNFTQDSYADSSSESEAHDTYIFSSSGAAGQEEDDASSSGPWMICEIKAEGLRNISKRTITKNISAKENKLYHRSSIQEDVSALMALGNFDHVEIDISPIAGFKKNNEDKEDTSLRPCNRLTVVVEEKPIFEKILFKGRKALSKSAIQNAMSLKIKDPFSESKLASDMDRIRAAYAEKGYINAQPSFTFELDKKTNTITVTIIVDEGQRTRVKDVVVEGLQELPVKKIIGKMANRPGKIFKTQKLQQDAYKVTIFARNEGFFDFKIEDRQDNFTEDKSLVTLIYKMHEGKKAMFGTTSFEGNNIFTDKELQNIVFYRKGALFNQQKFDTTVRDIQEQYANKGFLRADITPVKTFDEETGKLNIKFDISENNLVFIDHIDITGNESTKTFVFARELTIKEGDVFNLKKVRRSQAKIMNLGFINDVQLSIDPTNDPSKVDVGYNVVEGRPGMFTAGVAMSSLDGLYGDFSVTHMNLFGRAQRLSLRALFGSRVLDYTLSWTTPWIGDKPISFGVDAFNTRRYRSYMTSSSAYTERRVGGRLRLGPRFNDDIYNLNFSYTFENIDIYDINPAYEGIDTGLVAGRNNVSSFGAGFAIDTRDNYWDPTEGARNSIGVDVSGGPFFGDVDLYRTNFKSAYNKTLINIGKDYPIVLMIANRVGMVKPFGRTDIVPAYERFFLGGADTVRGYQNTGEIGPLTGGELYYIGNVELKFPLAREGRRTIAQFATFFDIGNSWKSWDDIRLKTGTETDEFKMGVGFGLRFVTPSLPIRLDWGYGLNHKTGARTSQIYFSMANLF